MPTPFSISAFRVRGYTIAEDVVGVNTLMQSPLVVAGRPSSAREDYNYKSFRARLLVVICTGDGRSNPTLSRHRFSGGIRVPAFAKCKSCGLATRPMARCNHRKANHVFERSISADSGSGSRPNASVQRRRFRAVRCNRLFTLPSAPSSTTARIFLTNTCVSRK